MITPTEIRGNGPREGDELFGISQIEHELPALKGIINLDENGSIIIPQVSDLKTISDNLFFGLPRHECEYVNNRNTNPFVTSSSFSMDLINGIIGVPRVPGRRLDLIIALIAASCLPNEPTMALSEIVYSFGLDRLSIRSESEVMILDAINESVENEVVFSLVPDFDNPTRLKGAFLLSAMYGHISREEEQDMIRKELKKMDFEVNSEGIIPRELEIVDNHYRQVKERLSNPGLVPIRPLESLITT